MEYHKHLIGGASKRFCMELAAVDGYRRQRCIRDNRFGNKIAFIVDHPLFGARGKEVGNEEKKEKVLFLAIHIFKISANMYSTEPRNRPVL
jgi:hypothetical protein